MVHNAQRSVDLQLDRFQRNPWIVGIRGCGIPRVHSEMSSRSQHILTHTDHSKGAISCIGTL